MSNDPSQPDPLIDEIRSIREEISNRFNNDVDKLCDYLQQLEREHPDRMATPEQLRPRQPAK